MKFRYKVLILNLLLLSLATAVVGFLLMKRSYRLTLDTAVKSAVTENNLVQSSVEYALLEVVNTPGYNLNRSLPEIGRQVFSGMISGEEALAIRYNGNYVYTSESDLPTDSLPEDFYNFDGRTGKNYLFREEDGKYFLYVITHSTLDQKILNIITRRDASDIQAMLSQGIREYREITLLILAVSALLIYILSRLLTRPLEKLSRTTETFASGDYAARSEIHTSDEVGQLSEQFNTMADSVETHVEELNEMVHRREQFVADFTHEIKTPMTSIIGYADTLRSMDLDREEQLQSLNYIFSEGKRLEAMSMKLFDLLYLKDHPIEKKRISAEKLAESVRVSMLPLLNHAGQTLEIHVDPGFLEGDPDLLKTVFINLIDNARKAGKENDVILLTGVREQAPDKKEDPLSYRFTVEDHGIGISEEDQKRIFDEFYMADKSRTRAAGGAGLGLSLVAVILERHQAEISLTSKPGQGTRIAVTFPGVPDTVD
ncbi:MAG: HAMP domain-containing histidine kinase [Eubacterium sp.]|nr:HAMP domain-containing histidine kinase [Eubacterium sp.]